MGNIFRKEKETGWDGEWEDPAWDAVRETATPAGQRDFAWAVIQQWIDVEEQEEEKNSRGFYFSSSR
jgi:hypothetical protein